MCRVTAEGLAALSFGLLHTAKHLGSALVGLAGRSALRQGSSGDTCLMAGVSGVHVRGVRAGVLQKEGVEVPTAPSLWDGWTGD